MHETAGAEGAPSPLVWRSLPLRLALAAIPLWLTVFVLLSNVGAPIKLVIAIAFGVSLADPVSGLLLVAAIAPLGELVAQAIGASTFRITEAVVLAFLGAWLVRACPDRRGPRTAATAAGWLFAATIAASVGGLALQLSHYPADFDSVIDQLVHIYFFVPDRLGIVDGARLLEGMGLSVATVVLFRRHPRLAVKLPLALAVGAAMAALSSVLLWRGIGSATALARYKAIGYRVSGHIGDVNAAGSYFAMMLCLGAGMALRERGRRRLLWLCLTAASGVGLWFSESRSALGAAAAVVLVAALWTATRQMRPGRRAAALTALVVVLAGGAFVRARLLERDPTYRGAGFREQFVQTSLRMIEARPLFGVGIGQYNRMSSLFLSPQLGWTYGYENAHNYFLQVGGELGLIGLALFLAWIAAPLVRSARALTRAPADWRLAGSTSGLIAFLITCMAGHPFLIGEVAYPFWIQFGLVAALAGSTLLNRVPAVAAGAHTHRPTRRALSLITAAAAVAIVSVSPITAARAAVSPPESQGVDGFYGWETLEDGTRFRWTGAYASLFVPADVTRVEIPVRLPTNGRSVRPMGVEVMTSGVDRGRTIVAATWAILSLPLPDVAPPARFKRIDLKVDRVWQPALYIAGSADMRSVGVQVAEPRLFRN